MIKFYTLIALLCIQFALCEEAEQNEVCNKNHDGVRICGNLDEERYIFYDVNPPEGFNLRRDVYLRLAVWAHKVVQLKKHKNIKLVLPPWNSLYHWQSGDIGSQKNIPWSLFFNIDSLKQFAPVVEMHEVYSKAKPLCIDRIYMLNHFKDMDLTNDYSDKFEIEPRNTCHPDGFFWGLKNITYKYHECLNFQASVDKLTDVLDIFKGDRTIMFVNAEVAMHDEYGSKVYWDGRKSMKFSMDLIKLAEDFIEIELNCFKEKCDNYVSVHWRRGDFARGRRKEVPSVQNTAVQIHNQVRKNYQSLIKTVFIATDAISNEIDELIRLLQDYGYIVVGFSPSFDVRKRYKDGGVAIIDQIICSHAAYFIGTHESTFTFRIQEEREILQFDSVTTFNRLCPDKGKCERMSRWTLVQ